MHSFLKLKLSIEELRNLLHLNYAVEHRFNKLEEEITTLRMLQGKQLANEIKKIKKIKSLEEVEFKVFSQFGDDGIIQYLINKIKIQDKVFVEFGVGDYKEANTRFLLMNNNWSGLVADSSLENIKELKKEQIFWRHNLKAVSFFVTRENINEMIRSQGFSGEIGLLHIDLDGIDYWVWQDLTVIKPVIVILEYNSVFGIKRPVTIPYKKDFGRTKAHYSNLYWGSSLPALYLLSKEKGYSFVGCNRAGNNAYFVRKDKLGSLKSLKPEEGYVLSKYRESRDKDGKLTYLAGEDRLEAIKGMPVFNTVTKKIEML